MRQYLPTELNDVLLHAIVSDLSITTVQTENVLNKSALIWIDHLLALREDITFRVFGSDIVDLSFLQDLPHLRRLSVDLYDFPSLDCLCGLPLRTLSVNTLETDYTFVQALCPELESLSIAPESSGRIRFDCAWLARFPKLHTLYLRKVKTHVETLAQLPALKTLALRGINTDLCFLKDSSVETLAIHWGNKAQLDSLACNSKLCSLELWRINGLDTLSFATGLSSLHTLRLLDLPKISSLAPLRQLPRLTLIESNRMFDEKETQGLPFHLIHW